VFRTLACRPCIEHFLRRFSFKFTVFSSFHFPPQPGSFKTPRPSIGPISFHSFCPPPKFQFYWLAFSICPFFPDRSCSSRHYHLLVRLRAPNDLCLTPPFFFKASFLPPPGALFDEHLEVLFPPFTTLPVALTPLEMDASDLPPFASPKKAFFFFHTPPAGDHPKQQVPIPPQHQIHIVFLCT